jgi:hypothetical protein
MIMAGDTTPDRRIGRIVELAVSSANATAIAR